jgi:hypothetical protein
VLAGLRPVPFTNLDGSEGVDLYLDRDLFPEAELAFSDPAGPPASGAFTDANL